MTKTRLLKHFLLLFALIAGSTSVWAEDTTVSYGWEDSDDVTKWTITEAIEKTSGQGNTGTYAGKINTNHTYVQFKEKVFVKSFSFAFKRTSNNNNHNVYIETSTDGETWTAVETYAMSSFGNGSYTTKTHTFDGTKEYYVRFHCYNTTAVRYVDDVTITYSNGASIPPCAAPTFQPAAGLYSSSQNVTISSETEGAEIYYTMGDNPADPTTSSNKYTSPITVDATTTIKAIAVAVGYENSAVVTAKYVLLKHAGTEADPYSVADARAAIDAETGTEGVYATGIVSAIPTAYSDQYSNITFNFVDNEGDSDFLQAFRCVGTQTVDASKVAVGDVVVVYGNLTKYGSTYEFGQGCQLVSLTHPLVTSIVADDVEIEADQTSGEIEYTIINPVEETTLTASTEADWISNFGYDDEGKVTFTAGANTGDARTATVTLKYGNVATKVVTITQAKFVPSATLPFAFDGGLNDISTTDGLIQRGLGTDYNSSPKLKFDGTGDYLILKFNEAPGVLTFDIKGNTFSGGTFTVQTSADGVAYTDLKVYTDLTSTILNEEFDNLGENVRFIKWIYTSKSTGNVALGNITLAKYVDPSTISQIEADDVEIAYNATSGEIPFTIVNPVENASFGAGTFDTPWITNVNAVKIDATHYKVTFATGVNTGDERSATITINYNGVTKDVTVTQTAAPVVSGSEINAVDGITLEADATSGEITYTITNPVAGVMLTAEVSPDIDWISGIVVTDEKVTFTVTPNEYADKRMTVMYLHYGSTVHKNVTITQKAYIPQGEDVTNLPFTFNDGVNSVAPCDGLSQEGLGKDYSSAPYLKFDSTGDWLLLHFNESPGTLTFDIKGNTFSGGTFTVQTSVDGTTYTDLKSYTELGDTQHESFDNLGEDVRYIKWIYTNKSSGNVALGNITLAKPNNTPSITVDPETVNVDADGGDGTITVTYNNITEVIADFYFCDADGDEATYDWLEAEIDDDNNLYYVIDANEGEARTAYMIVYAFDDDDNGVYSDLITITQAAYAAPGNWVETELADLTENDVFVIVGDNGDTYAMSNDNGTTAAPAAVSVTVSGNTLTGEIAANIQWNVSYTDDGYIFYPNGSTETWLYCTNSNTGVRVGTNDNKTFTVDGGYLKHVGTSRYVGIYNSQDWRCYTNTDGNIAGQTFKFYKKVGNTVSVTISQYKYASFSSDKDLNFTPVTGLKAYIVTDANGSAIITQQVTKVKAGTGLVLYSETAGSYNIPIADEGDDFSDCSDNKLIAVTEDNTVINKATDGTTNYVLTVKNDKAVFAYINNTPATLNKGQAYLNLEGEPSAPYLGFDGEGTTGIVNVNRETITNNQYYTLDGRRVENPSNGVYIVNGKKVVIK